jgi:hypothetical protein
MTTVPLSPEATAALEKLRDIHLPPPVSWWPIAPGWWGLLALFCAALLLACWQEARRRRGLRHLALAELRELHQRLDTVADPAAVGVTLAVLLRRVALSARTSEVAAVTGDAWISVLTRGKAALSQPVADYIAAAPYAPNAGADTRPNLLLALAEAERWIKGQS